jgi:hypothetical protein
MRLVLAMITALLAIPAFAQDAAVETTEVEGTVVRLHVHDFLKADELQVLRLVATNADARGVFVPEGEGFAALAVAPREGFVRKGAPVPSATAVAGAETAEAAAAQATEACNGAKKRGPDCVIVLEVAAAP